MEHQNLFNESEPGKPNHPRPVGKVILIIILGLLVLSAIIVAVVFGARLILRPNSPAPGSIFQSMSTPQAQIAPFDRIAGEEIFFSRNNNYYIMSLDGTKETLIAKNPEAAILCPTVSPDGEQLLFTSNIDGPTEIYTVQRDGSNLRNITKSNGFDIVCGSWSPDQQRILFYRQYSTTSDIFVIGSDGKNEINITNSFVGNNGSMNVISETPWSPDGRKFVFQSNRDGNFNLYIYDFDTQQTIKVTDSPNDNTKASWSPDGKKIVYTSIIDGQNTDIFIIDLSWNNLPTMGINITNNPAADTDGSWSPNSQQIIFVSDRDGNREIYTMDISGQNLKRLTNSAEDENRPRWIK